MKVVYLTTAVESDDFRILIHQATIKPNPAGQNFHQKLIHALLLFADVDVFSLIPNHEDLLNARSFDPEGPLKVTYFAPSHSKPGRFFSDPHKMAQEILSQEEGEEQEIRVVYDSLNVTLGKVASYLHKKKGWPVCAILTDDPRNITHASKRYIAAVQKNARRADGYFALTEGLLKCFGAEEKPHLIQEGIIEKMPPFPSPHPRPYIYFGGALYVKYGVKVLVDGYLLAHPPIDLVIAGHGPFENVLQNRELEKKGVYFKGMLSKEDHYAYCENATLLVNPRPYRKSLDEVSVPSKVLEYLSTGNAILTTLSTPLEDKYGTSLNLLEYGNKDPSLVIASFLKEHITPEGALKNVLPNRAASLVLQDDGEYMVGKNFSSFLLSLDDPESPVK